MSFRDRALAAAAIGAIAAALGPHAFAQTAPAGPAPVLSAQQVADAVAEVVVTAQRRSENLQKVPLAITVVSGDQLAARQTASAEQLVEQVPSLTFRKGTTNVNSALNIRGVGTISFASGAEPAVSTVVDGVVLARPGQATFDFLDLDHIEVLRGPQGTLFGKNASAGLLNIVTRRPSATPQGFAEVGIFEGDEEKVRGQVSGPITSTLRGSLAGLYSRYDGNSRNVYNGDVVNGYEHLGGRGKLEWTPTNDLTVTLIGDYLHEVDDASADVIGKLTNTAYNTAVFAPSVAPVQVGKHNFDIDNDITPKTTDSNWGFSGQADWKFGDGYTLTSITAYRNWRNVENRDGDFRSDAPKYVNAGAGAGDVGTRDVGFLRFEQWTQELRIASPAGRFFDWQAGVFYYHTDQENDFNRFARSCPATAGVTYSATIPTPCPAGGVATAANGTAHWSTTLENYAVFGQGVVHLSDRIRLTGGVRWSHDEVSYAFARVAAPSGPGVNPSFSGAGDTTADGWTARASAEYDVTPGITGYLSYGRGYKGPAINVFFNMLARDQTPLSPETSNDYEAGLKSRLFSGRVVLNLAAFYEEFDGYQTNFFDNVAGQVVSRLINAGTVSTRGLEADYTAKPIRNLTLSGGATYAWAQIDRFDCPVGAAVTCAAAINGKALPYAPKYKLNVAADYRVVTTLPVDVGLNTGYSWQSTTQFDINQSPDGIQPSYGLWDASVSLLDKSDRWRLSFLVRNITDQFYTDARVPGAQVRFQIPRDAQRYVGLVLRANFGG